MENRYDKYKDSGIAWIGEIPEHWEVIKIKQLLKNNSLKVGPFGSQLSGSDILSDGKYWIYNQRTVLDNNFSSCNSFITHEKYNDLIGFKVNAGDILLTTRGTIGKISRVPTTFNEGVIHPCIIRFNINESILKYDILKYIFNDSDLVINQVKYNSNSTTIDVIYSDTLKNIILTCIPKEEQQSIATYLDQKCSEIDELITLQEEMITKLESYKQSVITEAVTKGLDKNVPLKDSGIEWIGEIPEHWNFRRIKTFSSVKRGASPRPIDDPKYFDDNGEFAWVRIADVSASDKYLEATTQKLSELGSSLSVKRYPGDIFISIAGTVGKPIISNIKCCIHDGFVYFPNMEGINVEYLYYIFLSGQPYLGLGKMGTQLNLNTETIGNIYIPSPNIVEQTKIVCFLCQKCSEIDALISIKQQKIEKLKDYKKSLIFECVTGKRKVS